MKRPKNYFISQHQLEITNETHKKTFYFVKIFFLGGVGGGGGGIGVGQKTFYFSKMFLGRFKKKYVKKSKMRFFNQKMLKICSNSLN